MDEHCDLTLDKLVDNYRKKKDGLVPTHTIETPQTSEELLEILAAYKSDDKKTNLSSHWFATDTTTPTILETKPKKKSLFDKVKTIFSK